MMFADQIADRANAGLGLLALLAAVFVISAVGERIAGRPKHMHTAQECRAGGNWLVNESQVSFDGHLSGGCPACGKTNVCCTVVDEKYYLSPWVIDGHEPFIHPELGLHENECWAEKRRTGDTGLCVCTGVAA